MHAQGGGWSYAEGVLRSGHRASLHFVKDNVDVIFRFNQKSWVLMGSVDLWLLLAVVLFATTVQNIVGFGFALLAVPIMALFIDTHDGVVIATFLGFISSGFQAWSGRREADYAVVRKLSFSCLLGIPLGLIVFSSVDVQVLKVLLGVGVLCSVVLLVKGSSLPNTGVWLEWVAGILSGALAASLSTNGPPLVFALQSRKMPIARFRATISMIFTVSGVVTLLSFALLRKVTQDQIGASLTSVPVLLIGIFLGRRLQRFVNEAASRQFVLALLTVAGISALIAGLSG